MLLKRFPLWSLGRTHKVPFHHTEVRRGNQTQLTMNLSLSRELELRGVSCDIEKILNVIGFIINIELITKFFHKLKDKTCVTKTINMTHNIRII